MIEGIFTAIITPFYKDLEIDYELLAKLTKFQEKNGISGIVPCGTNGEFSSLTLEESKKVIKTVVDAKKNIIVISGVGRASIKETIELAKYSDGLTDAIMIGVPYYFKPVSDLGLYQYFSVVLEKVKCQSFLYNIPKYTGISLTVELIKKLSKFPNLVGLKDSSGELKITENYISNLPKLNIFSGSDALVFAGLRSGTKGGISAIGNIYPKKVMNIFNAFKKSDLKLAEKEQNELSKIRDLFKKYETIATFKKYISILGFKESYVRPPLHDLSNQEFSEIKSSLKSLGNITGID